MMGRIVTPLQGLGPLSVQIVQSKIVAPSFGEVIKVYSYTGCPPPKKKKKKKPGSVDGLCSDQQLSLYTLLDRASFPHYNNSKIIKFGWELLMLWVIYYGLMKITHEMKSSQSNFMILVLI